jgi:hypothetical protein
MKSKFTSGEPCAADAATSRATPIHALGVDGEGPRPSDPQRPICECSHPRTDHEDCGNGLVVCFHRVGPYGEHPLDGVCVCCNYIDEAERTCDCGCGRSLEGRRSNTQYALTACRVRAKRNRNAGVTNRSAAPNTAKRSHGPSGLQLPYARMVRALIAEYRDLNLPNAEARAVEMVRGMLSDRQRATLDERSTG